MLRAYGCPECGHPDASSRCWECGWTYEDEAATTDTTPEARRRSEPPPAPRDSTEPVHIRLSWENLASDNKRKGLDRAAWAEYKAARDGAQAEAMQQCPTVAFPEAPVRVSVAFRVPDRRRRDPNNLTKLLCDALASVVYGDDAQIVALSWTNEGVSDRPGADVTVARHPVAR